MTGKQLKQSTLIASLLRPDAYPHPTTSFELLETHISWVVLTGAYAYKIKKAVCLDFLDFSSLEKRQHYCEEELRLNHRFAPMLYLGVVPIGGSVEHPVVEGRGTAIEYAVKMRQFPQSAQLDKQLDAGLLHEHDVEALADTIAGYHLKASVIPFRGASKAIQSVKAPILDNFAPIRASVDMKAVRRIQAWTEASLQTHQDVLIERHESGYVRECHGDLHLANLVRLADGIVAFDCVEFSAALRNIDVISDIAFLAMDLVARARQDLAAIFINRYLERSGDYAGMTVFGFYFVYHAMIRAKVAAVRSTGMSDDAEKQHQTEQLKHYLAVALRWIKRPKPQLIAMHGYSGSGKTWLSSELLSRLPAIRVRTDIERKRSRDFGHPGHNTVRPGEGDYSDSARSDVYEKMMVIIRQLLTAGYNVIADASFLSAVDRELISREASRGGVSLVFVDARASDDELQQRLYDRNTAGGDASDATCDVLLYQRELADALSATELSQTVPVVTDQVFEVDLIIKAIKRLA
jgi:aminoglycoside phosphotransferase family enzyme/predicted kinase